MGRATTSPSDRALPTMARDDQDRAVPTVEDATPERWDDLLAVFGSGGDPAHCWCQWFRQQRPGYAARSSEQRRADLQA